MIQLKDQLGRQLVFRKTPQRIVSLVPSITELLVDLGLRENIYGLTKFCIHPQNLKSEKLVVGGTKQVDYESIKTLQPDIIICNKEENTEEMVGRLSEIASVHVSDIFGIQDTIDLILQYGILFDRAKIAQKLSDAILSKSQNASQVLSNFERKKVAYFIWRKPYMVAGGKNFIHSLLDFCNFENVCKEAEGRYPEIEIEDLSDVDYLFLSSEPYPFAEKHISEMQGRTKAKVVLVDGEYFSWYGSRLLTAFDYFLELRKELEL